MRCFSKTCRQAHSQPAYGLNRYYIEGKSRLPAGKHQLRMEFAYDGGGLAKGGDVTLYIFSFDFTPTGKPDIAKGKGVPAKIKLYVDGKPVGRGDLPVTIPLQLGLAAGVSIGADAGSPVMIDYKAPFTFGGTVKKALVDVSGEPIEDKEAKMRMYLARQ
jgi:hypothetical protein